MIDTPLVRKLVKLAIEEDLSHGDITSELSCDQNAAADAQFIAKERLIVCGVPILPVIFDELGFKIKLHQLIKEGNVAKPGQAIARIQGKVVELLALERTALNFMQRMSGIATFTHGVVAKAKKLTVLDTRKTAPGHRYLDKYAVRIGGARNHRFSLGDMILLKNNHIDAQGGSVTHTLKRVYSNKPPYMPVEVEVRNFSELREALAFKPEIIMLDNMNDKEVARAVREAEKVSPRTMIEVSGGITSKRFSTLSRIGVKLVSMGSLTNKSPASDIALRISLKRESVHGGKK